MPSHDIICPECFVPATKWFEFGGQSDPHGYYHCATCGRSCAVQLGRDGPGRQSAWVREKTRAAEPVSVRPKRDRRRAPRLPPQAVARRAYELHEQRGGEHGHDLDDWLRAERDLGGSPYSLPQDPATSDAGFGCEG